MGLYEPFQWDLSANETPVQSENQTGIFASGLKHQIPGTSNMDSDFNCSGNKIL